MFFSKIYEKIVPKVFKFVKLIFNFDHSEWNFEN